MEITGREVDVASLGDDSVDSVAVVLCFVGIKVDVIVVRKFRCSRQVEDATLIYAIGLA